MKTTINLPEDVLVKAKVFAEERRTTLREPVVQGLKQVMDGPLADEEKATQGGDQAIARCDAGQQHEACGSPETGGNLRPMNCFRPSLDELSTFEHF